MLNTNPFAELSAMIDPTIMETYVILMALRMNRTIKDATVKRYHYDRHDHLRTHLSDFLNAYNYARRLKTLSGLTPYEYICKIWSSEPDRFILNPIHHMPGLNN